MAPARPIPNLTENETGMNTIQQPESPKRTLDLTEMVASEERNLIGTFAPKRVENAATGSVGHRGKDPLHSMGTAMRDSRAWGFPMTIFVVCGLIDLLFMHEAFLMVPLAGACLGGYVISLVPDKWRASADSGRSPR